MQITGDVFFSPCGIGRRCAALVRAGMRHDRRVSLAARRYFRNLVNYLETLSLRGYPYPNLNATDQKGRRD
jgi:hypothetical protein